MITYNFNLITEKGVKLRSEYSVNQTDLTVFEIMQQVIEKHNATHIQLVSVVVQ